MTDSGDKQKPREDVDSQETVVSPGSSEYLSRPARDGAAESAIPSRVGGFRITALIGKGGMGIVYAAIQDQPRRTVALKLLRPDLLTPELQRRFDHEAEVLALLQHDGIARIYETGHLQTPFGEQPYFAMELVEGGELIDWADEHDLRVERRVQLMIDLSEAVHAAHMRGVIHRDLKPANVLVTDEGKVKILDFGLARLSDGLTDEVRTMTGQLVGTLNYMSPEQAEGRQEAVDVRSDVYSLGVILHRLLTGELPLDTSGLSLMDAVAHIRDAEPHRLGACAAELSGDLEVICAKALAKDVSERYESAAAFAADLRAWTVHEPISARAPSTVYRLRKFARRHRVLVTAAFSVVAALLIGTVVAVMFAIEAKRAAVESHEAGVKADEEARRAEEEARRAAAEARRAEAETRRAEAATGRAEKAADLAKQQARRARRLSSFIIDTFLRLNPVVTEGKETTLREAFISVESQFEAALEDDPYSRAELHNLFAQLWRSFGEIERARRHATDAVRVSEGLVKEGPVHAFALQTLAWIEFRSGQFESAKARLVKSLDILDDSDVEESLFEAYALCTLAEITAAQGDVAAAERLARDSLAMRRRLVEGDHDEVADGYIVLSNVLRQAGKLAEAKENARSSLRMRRRLFGENNPTVAECLSALSHFALIEGDNDEARELLEEAYEIQKVTLEPGSRALAITETNIGYIDLLEEDFESAVAWFEPALTSFEGLFGKESIDVADICAKMAEAHQGAGQHEKAVAFSERSLDILGARPERAPVVARVAASVLSKESFGKEHIRAAKAYLIIVRASEVMGDGDAYMAVSAAANASLCFFRDGQLERAIDIAEDLLVRLRKSRPRHDHTLAVTLLNLGNYLAADDENDEAEDYLLEAEKVVKGLEEPDADLLAAIRETIAQHYEKTGRPDEARRFRDE